MSGNSRGSGAIAPAEFAAGLGFRTDVVEPVDITSLLDRLPEPDSDGAAMFRPFFLRAAAAVPFIRTLLDEWRPDAILTDTAGLDASAIAEQTTTPLATFDFAPALSGMLDDVAPGEVAWFRQEMGLSPDLDPELIQNRLTIVGAPPSWFEGYDLPGNTHFVQPMEPEPVPGESVAALLDSDDERPLVYLTFGTAFNTPELFQLVFDAVADLDVRVIATIGMNNEAGDLEVPGNVQTVPFVSQGLILEHADCVVAHGGYVSLTGALKRGVPVLSLPLAPPDNRFNAAQLVKLGAGLHSARTSEPPRRSAGRFGGSSTTENTEPALGRSQTRSLRSHPSIMPLNSSNESHWLRPDQSHQCALDNSSGRRLGDAYRRQCMRSRPTQNGGMRPDQ